MRAGCACRRSSLGRVRYNTKNSAEDERTMIVQKVVSIYTSPALGVNSMRLQHKDGVLSVHQYKEREMSEYMVTLPYPCLL